MRKLAIGLAAAAALGAGAAHAASGEEIYKQVCFACHATGAAGAPKVGDKAAWAPRIAQGMDTLVQRAMNGFNAMPPKGTCGQCSEADIRAVVEYMVSQSK
ncbi:c-type cytochrome [Inmirania thermothiophila]|uniref:Cytochrome c5 n=1 Tax=Inmirania thermothiophila TaxID=1750597 RepID=A0A3N1Y9I9_9GAMM|nr:c-type cytochrome [Inmirania thermothiophila]ROR34282.1 cytochrome c5 [Inmirania thermothiophila]